jgi:hypothetical protein
MLPLYYLLLLQPRSVPAPPPPSMAGGTNLPRRRRPLLSTPAPDFSEFINREEEEALIHCRALG